MHNENSYLPKASIWKRGFESNTANIDFIIFGLLHFVRNDKLVKLQGQIKIISVITIG